MHPSFPSHGRRRRCPHFGAAVAGEASAPTGAAADATAKEAAADAPDPPVTFPGNDGTSHKVTWDDKSMPGPGKVSVPGLSNWRAAESDPERRADYDDSGWTKADRATADNPQHGPGEVRDVVLDADEYGFHEGDVGPRGERRGGGCGTRLGRVGGPGAVLGVAFWTGRTSHRPTRTCETWPTRVNDGHGTPMTRS